MTENEIGRMVVDAAIAVYRALGPGLLETVYEVVPAHELRKRGLVEKLPLRLCVLARGSMALNVLAQ
jgi:GxxExxY protein